MEQFPGSLDRKLQKRVEENMLRRLPAAHNLVDFSSNDYLGFSRRGDISQKALSLLDDYGIAGNGATGSRLITGNHALYGEAENTIASFHKAEAALLFNSGYDANVGLFSSVPQKGDIVLYDEYIHASIRDGLRLSNATSYKFRHNDTEALKSLLEKYNGQAKEIYVVTESVFSMDGDTPGLARMCRLCSRYNAYLVVDEAHAVGVSGRGRGMVQELVLQAAES